MSKSNKTAKTKSKASGFSDSNPTMFTMGYVDLIFKLNLTDKDLEKASDENQNNEQNQEKKKENEEDKYYKIEDVNSILDLNFIKDKKEIWDKIIVSGGNDTMKQLLIGNKTSKKKCKIDFIGFGRPKFEGDEDFFDEIFNYVTAKNHLIINKTPLDEGARSSLTIILNHKGKTQTIFVGKSQEEEDKENKIEEAKALLPHVFALIDSAKSKNIIHANNAANKKARLSKKLNGKSAEEVKPAEVPAEKIEEPAAEPVKEEVKEEPAVEEPKKTVRKPRAKKEDAEKADDAEEPKKTVRKPRAKKAEEPKAE